MPRTLPRWSICIPGLLSLPLIGCSSSRTVATNPSPRSPDHFSDHHVVVSEANSHDLCVVIDDPGDPSSRHSTHGHGPKRQFTYYSNANVYYDTEARRYFWIQNDEWVVGERLPRRIVLHADSAESLWLDPDQPYVEHSFATGSDHRNHAQGTVVGHDRSRGKARGKGRQTASAVGESP